MPKFMDLAGQRFGLWSVLSRVPRTKPGGTAKWLCRCACGTEKIVDSYTMRSGESRSCGCATTRFTYESRKTHKKSGTRLHRIWKNMRKRCLSPNEPSFPNYGGRGIAICDEWSDFQAFHDWAMSVGYMDDLTIERVDVNGNYEPGNCTWIPKPEQAKNKQSVHRDPNGVAWRDKAIANGIPSSVFRCRLHYGWSFEEASTRPVIVCPPRKHKVSPSQAAVALTKQPPEQPPAICR
jgi:hypothetical protein